MTDLIYQERSDLAHHWMGGPALDVLGDRDCLHMGDWKEMRVVFSFQVIFSFLG